MDTLEPRLVLAALQPTSYEQYFLELVNRARANPAAEAARLGIALNEGLAAGTISTAAKQPLSMNAFLVDAARTHATWLRTNSKFQHAGPNNNTPAQRMATAGYSFSSGTSGSGENIGMTLSSTLGDLADRVEAIYRDLFLDTSVNGRGHRLNIFNATFDEMGAGLAHGSYTYNGSSAWTSVIIGQDLAYTAGNPYIVGVAFNDKLEVNNFYSPGEGMASIPVVATAADGVTKYTATTNAAGGYSLQVPAGTYTLTATNSSGVAKYVNVVVGSQNVKYDFSSDRFQQPVVIPNPTPLPTPAPTNFSSLSDTGVLTVNGTSEDDIISVTIIGGEVVVQLNNGAVSYDAADVKFVLAYGQDGNDSITMGESVARCTLMGGDGNDTLIGTASNDRISGGEGNDIIISGGGNDTIFGGNGNDEINGGGGKDIINGDDGDDRLNGAGGADQLYGGSGNDRLYGADGDDWLEGGGNVDRLYGGLGNDSLFGGSSNDRLYGDEGDDVLTGNLGNDYIDGGLGKNKVRDWGPYDNVQNATI